MTRGPPRRLVADQYYKRRGVAGTRNECCRRCGKQGKLKFLTHKPYRYPKVTTPGPDGLEHRTRTGAVVDSSGGRYYPYVIHYDSKLYHDQKLAYERGERKSKGNGTVTHYYYDTGKVRKRLEERKKQREREKSTN